MYVPRGNPKLCNVSRTVVRHKYTRVQAKVHTGTTRASESFHPKLQPQETVASNHRKKQKKQVRNPELLCNLPRPHPTCGQTPASSLSSNATSSLSRTSKDGKEEEEAEENERAFETPGAAAASSPLSGTPSSVGLAARRVRNGNGTKIRFSIDGV